MSGYTCRATFLPETPIVSRDLIAERLRLVSITSERMDADEANSPILSSLLSAEVPAAWPPEHWEPHVFIFLKQQMLDHPETVGWNRYVVLQGERPTLIGTIGAFWRSESEAEIGYSILEPWRRRGLATEGVVALTEELFRKPELRTITAQTFPDLLPSIGVLTKCGFQLVGSGDDEGTIRFCLTRP